MLSSQSRSASWITKMEWSHVLSSMNPNTVIPALLFSKYVTTTRQKSPCTYVSLWESTCLITCELRIIFATFEWWQFDHSPRACLFWNEIVCAKIGTNLVLSRSSSPSPSSSSDSQTALIWNTWAEVIWPLGVSPSVLSKEFIVAQACHFAARLVMECALCVIFVALRRHMKSPVTRLIEHICTIIRRFTSTLRCLDDKNTSTPKSICVQNQSFNLNALILC